MLYRKAFSIQRDICFVTHISFSYIQHICSHMTKQGVIEPLFTDYNLCFVVQSWTIYIWYEINYFLDSTKSVLYDGKLGKTFFSVLRWHCSVRNPIVKRILILSIFNYDSISSQTHPFVPQVIYYIMFNQLSTLIS